MIRKLLAACLLLLASVSPAQQVAGLFTPPELFKNSASTLSVTLNDVPAGRVFQRSTNNTTGPVTASGAYTGVAPSGMQAQVLNQANSVILDWTAGTCTIASLRWSCSFAGVPVGPMGIGSAGSKVINDSYHLKVRATNATALVATGSNQWWMGRNIMLYGQSNMDNFSLATSSPPAAATGTGYFDGITKFTASASGTTTLTVSAVTSGIITPGQLITNNDNLVVGTRIVSQITGPTGSTGTYLLDTANTIPSALMGSIVDDSTLIPYSAFAAGFIAVPGGNGVREFLNTMVATDGIPTGAFNHSVTGSTMSFLYDPALWSFGVNITASLKATGGSELMLWQQGEGDAFTSIVPATYWSQMTTMRSNAATLSSRTASQMPIIYGTLATAGATVSGTSAGWENINQILKNMEANVTAAYWAHSYIDAIRQPLDIYHYTAASYQKGGDRYARQLNVLNSNATVRPHWSIVASAVVDATHTDVQVTFNSDATNLSPTTNIYGFERSGDNGTTWNRALGAQHTSSSAFDPLGVGNNIIRLTHASLATNSNAKLRYIWGHQSSTGSINVGTNASLLVMDNTSEYPTTPTFLSVGQGVSIYGADAAAAQFDTTVSAISGQNVTLSSPATTSVSSLNVQTNPAQYLVDNSSLALPLTPSFGVLSPTPLASLPVPTYQATGNDNSGNQVMVINGLSLGAAASGTKFVIVSMMATYGVEIPSCANAVFTPDVSTATGCSVVTYGKDTAGALTVIFSMSVNQAATSLNFQYTWTQATFSGVYAGVWTVPQADMSSTTPTGSGSTATGGVAGLTLTTNLATTSGGFEIVTATLGTLQSAPANFSASTETLNNRFNIFNVRYNDDASGVATNAASVVTFTGDTPTLSALSAAAWR